MKFKVTAVATCYNADYHEINIYKGILEPYTEGDWTCIGILKVDTMDDLRAFQRKCRDAANKYNRSLREKRTQYSHLYELYPVCRFEVYFADEPFGDRFDGIITIIDQFND